MNHTLPRIRGRGGSDLKSEGAVDRHVAQFFSPQNGKFFSF
jgi:hypothetical protein